MNAQATDQATPAAILMDRAWTAALVNYQAADAAHDAQARRWQAAYDAIAAQLPAGLYEDRPNGRHARWSNVAAFDRDATVSPADRASLRPVLMDWLERATALELEFDMAALDAEGDATHGARADAYDALLATAPPNASALALKMLLHSQQCDDDGVGYANPNHAQDTEAYGAYAATGAAQFYRDAMALAALAA
jgi:hypothetical protein